MGWFQWLKIIAGAFAGFVASCIVQLVSLRWQERTQKNLLRDSLYRELVTIYIDLRDLLPLLAIDGPIEREENPANLPEFVKAECFNAAKSSPLFGRLKDALAIVQVHASFSYLAVSERRDFRSAASSVRRVLNTFRDMIDSTKLCRRDLLKSADGRLSETELTLKLDSRRPKLFERLRSWKFR